MNVFLLFFFDYQTSCTISLFISSILLLFTYLGIYFLHFAWIKVVTYLLLLISFISPFLRLLLDFLRVNFAFCQFRKKKILHIQLKNASNYFRVFSLRKILLWEQLWCCETRKSISWYAMLQTSHLILIIYCLCKKNNYFSIQNLAWSLFTCLETIFIKRTKRIILKIERGLNR